MRVDRTDEMADEAERRHGSIAGVHARRRGVVLDGLVLVAEIAVRTARQMRRQLVEGKQLFRLLQRSAERTRMPRESARRNRIADSL